MKIETGDDVNRQHDTNFAGRGAISILPYIKIFNLYSGFVFFMVAMTMRRCKTQNSKFSY